MNKNWLKEAYISFFFLGKAPFAPGTFGTCGGVILAFLSVNFLGNNATYFLFGLIAVMYYFGLVLAPWSEKKYDKDPGIYVLDEVIGYLVIIAFLGLLQSSLENHNWFLSFALFRIFDVIKLWPAKNLERLEGGHGILMDDIAAGFQTLIVILFLEMYNII
tara:strand:- start:120 stop:602 length:483 start_codon:yes stop_codon:yes gene_type:complete